VANQATEVIEVDKLDEQQPVDEEKEVKKRKSHGSKIRNCCLLCTCTAMLSAFKFNVSFDCCLAEMSEHCLIFLSEVSFGFVRCHPKNRTQKTYFFGVGFLFSGGPIGFIYQGTEFYPNKKNRSEPNRKPNAQS